jgi:hypothetical protein
MIVPTADGGELRDREAQIGERAEQPLEARARRDWRRAASGRRLAERRAAARRGAVGEGGRLARAGAPCGSGRAVSGGRAATKSKPRDIRRAGSPDATLAAAGRRRDAGAQGRARETAPSHACVVESGAICAVRRGAMALNVPAFILVSVLRVRRDGAKPGGKTSRGLTYLFSLI